MMIATEHRYQLPAQLEITYPIDSITSYKFLLGRKAITIYHNTERDEVSGEFTRNNKDYEITRIYIDCLVGACEAFSPILTSEERTECLKLVMKLPMRIQLSDLPSIEPDQLRKSALFIKSCAGEYSISIDNFTGLKVCSNHFGGYTYQARVAKIFDENAIKLFTLHPDQVEFYNGESKIEAICSTCLKKLSEGPGRTDHQVTFDSDSVPVLVKLQVGAEARE